MSLSDADRAEALRPRRRGGRWAIVAAGIVAVVVVVVVAVALGQSGDDDPADTQTSLATADGAPASSETADPAIEEPGSPVTFAPDEAHSELPPAAGCDQLYFHASMAMWNSVLADELLDYDCPFPYAPDEIGMEGGLEDPSLAAPFEPRRYQEVYDLVASETIGICAVSRVAEPSERGFVYGFRTTLRAETCANNDPNIELIIREYATRAHRDEAAHTLASAGQTVLVLGRWVVSLQGDDPDAIERLSTQLQAIGAVPVTA